MLADTIVKADKKQDVQSPLYTLEQYFELEEKSTHKNEFVNGKIIPMAGGTLNHMALSGMLYFLLLREFLSDKTISVITNDFKIYIPKHNKIVYADASVVIEKMELHGKGKQAYKNPSIIFEVLSDSTENYDRSRKFRMYETLPSFKEYVLVNQYMPMVEVYLRMPENKWQLSSYVGLDKIVKLETLNIELKMSDIYEKAENLQDPQLAMDLPETKETE